MSLTLYVALSVLIITVWHFGMNTNPRDFGLFQMIGIFILGGAIGWYMQALEFGLILSVVMSLIFI